jgi:hypothetical protein
MLHSLRRSDALIVVSIMNNLNLLVLNLLVIAIVFRIKGLVFLAMGSHDLELVGQLFLVLGMVGLHDYVTCVVQIRILRGKWLSGLLGSI